MLPKNIAKVAHMHTYTETTEKQESACAVTEIRTKKASERGEDRRSNRHADSKRNVISLPEESLHVIIRSSKHFQVHFYVCSDSIRFKISNCNVCEMILIFFLFQTFQTVTHCELNNSPQPPTSTPLPHPYHPLPTSSFLKNQWLALYMK